MWGDRMNNIRRPEERPVAPRKKGGEGLNLVTIIIIMVAITLTSFFITFGILMSIGPDSNSPYGVWSAKTIISPTEVVVDFGAINPRVKPVEIKLTLTRNDTIEGTYGFLDNDDGVLALTSGADVGTLTYSDSWDNGWIDVGDQIMLSGLSPGSHYKLEMIWAPTGDRITSTTFATPTG